MNARSDTRKLKKLHRQYRSTFGPAHEDYRIPLRVFALRSFEGIQWFQRKGIQL